MDNEFTDIEILRARAAQYFPLGQVHGGDDNGYNYATNFSVVHGAYWYVDLFEKRKTSVKDALEAAIRLGKLAREMNNG